MQSRNEGSSRALTSNLTPLEIRSPTRPRSRYVAVVRSSLPSLVRARISVEPPAPSCRVTLCTRLPRTSSRNSE
jgi:hypothetical protein